MVAVVVVVTMYLQVKRSREKRDKKSLAQDPQILTCILTVYVWAVSFHFFAHTNRLATDDNFFFTFGGEGKEKKQVDWPLLNSHHTKKKLIIHTFVPMHSSNDPFVVFVRHVSVSDHIYYSMYVYKVGGASKLIIT